MIVNFAFDKVSAEKIGKIMGNVNINHNFNIKDVESTEISFQGSKPALKILFEFKVDYEPKIGNIQMNGHLVYYDKEEEIKKSLDMWKKEKKLSTGLTTLVANTILSKGNVKALMLSQEVNLPPQIQLPKVTAAPQTSEPVKDDKKNEYIG